MKIGLFFLQLQETRFESNSHKEEKGRPSLSNIQMGLISRLVKSMKMRTKAV